MAEEAMAEDTSGDRDPPPGYDGREPDRTFPRWLKELKLWEYETEIPKALTDHFSPHLESSLPQAFESAIYGEPRGSRESFGDYVIRMEYAFKELERQKVPLHDIAVGYVMFRHANLNEVQQSQMLTWGRGSCDRKTVVENLRRLDKGNFDARRKGPSHYVTEVDEEHEGPDLTNETYVGEFLPEEGESDLDEGYVYIGENDMQDVINEDQMLEALATYQDVRRSLREQRTSRGYYPQGKSSSTSSGGGKGKGKGAFEGKGRPTLATKGRDKVKFTKHGTRVHVDMLKLRTRCARCGQGEFGVNAAVFDRLYPLGAIGFLCTEQRGVGLIGKASLLQLAQALREKGLQYRWNPKKKAQASGVGGRAEVIGVAEVPVGIAGVNGLMEPTVVTDNVPLLLPIKMLRQLRAVVDLDSDTLELKGFGVKTPMTKLPSGHMSVDVLSFAPEGWSLPSDAESNNLSQEQFVLVSSSFVNHSMTSLERPSVRKVKFEAVNHGADAPSAYVGSTRAGPPGHSRENVWSRDAKLTCHEEMACDHRHLMELIDVRGRSWDWLPDGSLRRLGLLSYPDQAPSLSTPISSTSTMAAPRDKQLEYAEIIKYAAFLGTRKAKEAARMSVEKCTHPTSELKGGGNQYGKDIHCALCLGRWAYLNPEELKKKQIEAKAYPLTPPRTSKARGSMSTTAGPMAGESSGSQPMTVVCYCQQPAYRSQVKKLGPTQGRHFYRCAKRLCEFFVWDEIERTELKRRLDAPAIQQMEVDETEAQDELYVQGPDGGFQIAHAE
ncbi:Top3a [Symbiodinium sp. CCMP2456]|nr:Top3a [Symbiodinium sp. CCMP2456]